MGKVISTICEDGESFKITAGLDINTKTNFSYPVYDNYFDCKENADVIIDFSIPAALNQLLEFAVSRKLPIVLCTTGITVELTKKIKEASKVIPVLQTPNTSLGINLILKLVTEATKTLGQSFDIEIIEKHHNQKIDAPSGTALHIADAINEASNVPLEYVYDRHSSIKKRSKNEIGIHAVRGGAIAGEHTVIFAGEDEIIEIKHTAVSIWLSF
jgi:4-hydroxy-tetrahydrodipicolinate reductase